MGSTVGKKGATAVRKMSTDITELNPRFLQLLEPKLARPIINKLLAEIKTESSSIFSDWFKIVKEPKNKQVAPAPKKIEIKTDSSFLSTVNESANLQVEAAEAQKKRRKEEKRKKKEQ